MHFFAFLCWHEMIERNAMMYLGLTLLLAAVVISRAAPLHNRTWAFRTSEIELEVKARAGDSDFMAGGGNGAGQAPEVRHQPPGDAHHLLVIMSALNYNVHQCSLHSG